MSYVSEKQGPNFAGLFGAIMINATIVIAALTAVHVVIPPDIKGIRTTVFDVPITHPPEKLPEIEKTLPDETRPQKTDMGEIGAVSQTATDFDTDASNAGISNLGGGYIEPVIVEPIEKIIPQPIFESAQRDPKYLSKFQPKYPTRLLSKNIEGYATIKILIGIDGRVRKAEIVEASHAAFGRAAKKQALKHWRFIPAKRDGKLVEDWQRQTIRFNIEG